MAIQNLVSAASGTIEPPDLWETRLSSRFNDLCPRLIEGPGGFAWAVGGKLGASLKIPGTIDGARPSRATMAKLATPAGRKMLQERDGVACEILYSVGSVWTLINESGNPEFITACYRAYNDWLSEFVRSDKTRYVGVAKIPTTGIEQATAELVRAAKELGLRGAVLDTWPAGAASPPALKKCESFWENAASLGIPVSIHAPLNGQRPEQGEILAGEAPEFVQDITAIMFANVFDRHPKLRIVSISPNVGWAPHMFEGMNESYMRTAALRKVNLGNPDLLPSDYLRRFVWFTTQDDRTALLNRAYFGAAHLMWASFAFMDDSVWPNTRQLFERVASGIPDGEREVLAADVASRLYQIGKAKPFSAEETTVYESYGLL